jgi:hypothetical protein
MIFDEVVNTLGAFDIAATIGITIACCWPDRDPDAAPPAPPLGRHALLDSADRSGASVPHTPDWSAAPTPVVDRERPRVDHRAYGRHAR